MAMHHNKGDLLKNVQQKLYLPGTKKRKVFGLLERPNLHPSIPQVSYKVFVTGLTGSGKTYLVDRLAGKELSNHVDTLGIEVTHVYWPMNIGNRLMLFRLELWDTGESSTKRYNHIKPACVSAVDGILVCFSVTNKEQWHDLPNLLSIVSQPSEKPAIMAVATRWDRPADIVVSESELRNFESRQEISILRLIPQTSGDESITITPTLNFICKQLWHRDQQLLSGGKDKA